MSDKPHWSTKKVFEILKEYDVSKKLVDEYEKLDKKPWFEKVTALSLGGVIEEKEWVSHYDETDNVVWIPQYITDNLAAILTAHELHHVLHPRSSLPTLQDAIDFELLTHNNELDLYEEMKEKNPPIIEEPEMCYFEEKSKSRKQDKQNFEEKIIKAAKRDYWPYYENEEECEKDE